MIAVRLRELCNWLAARRRRPAICAVGALALALAAMGPTQLAVASTGARAPDAAASVTLPDMKVLVPANQISIGTNSANGDRQLQYTHITWDAGTGPFEIDPTYNPATGTASFVQAIYNSPGPGVWQFDHSVPLAVTGNFDPPFDYRFPLTRFSLDKMNADGSAGSVVATSPKTDYCITGDAYVGGVPNTPSRTFIPQGNCTSPTKPLGWSVGWGDQYDQTDNGQPIDLTGVPNGKYVLQGTVDPDHLLTESNAANNAVDTGLQVTGNSVTVLSQTSPGVPPPTAALTSPADGASVSGTVTLQATASATAPATVASVQYLLDGQPLGAPVTAAPYAFSWTVGGTPLGTHQLSARVTDTDGNLGTAPVRTVTVVSGGSGGVAIDQSVTRTGAGAITTAAFSTAAAGETLLAFVGSDGPAGAGNQQATVSGAGLTWRLVRRSNGRPGDAEIWAATAAGAGRRRGDLHARGRRLRSAAHRPDLRERGQRRRVGSRVRGLRPAWRQPDVDGRGLADVRGRQRLRQRDQPHARSRAGPLQPVGRHRYRRHLLGPGNHHAQSRRRTERHAQ